WLTLVITGALIALCVLIRRHYRTVYLKLARLTEDLGSLPSVPPTTDPNTPPPVARELDARKSLAVLLVGGYGGLGAHSLPSFFRLLPGYFEQVMFLSVAVIDSGNFKGASEVQGLEAETRDSLNRYVDLAHRLGLTASSLMAVGTEAVAEAEQ